MNKPTIMPTYARLPVSFEKGDGVWLFDDKGDRYLDALAGIGVVGLGHAHPKISETLCEQSKKLIHTSNIYQIANQQKLADKLIEISGLQNCFFSNSGAEANEAALKIARLHARKKNIENPSVIVFDHAFHGRTMATLSATASRKVQAGFEPLVSGFVRAPFNDIAALENIATHNNQVTAVFIEPIQGEGGIHIANSEFLQSLRKLCDEKDWLLMFDEVQTGNGRTGKYFAFQHESFKPDLVTTAKGLGNGFPIGVCIAGEKAASLLGAGNHGSTYGGNHLSCACALTAVELINEPDFLSHVNSIAQYLLQELQDKLSPLVQVNGIRAKGLMIGIELNQDCGQLVSAALERKLLINVTANNVIRLLPPLILQEQEADIIVSTLKSIISDLSSSKT